MGTPTQALLATFECLPAQFHSRLHAPALGPRAEDANKNCFETSRYNRPFG